MWETSSDIPDSVVSAAYRFMQSISSEIPDNRAGEDLVSRVFAEIHPDLHKRLLLDMLRGTVTGRRLVKIDDNNTQFITAIKHVRAYTGLYLKEAKEAVESGDYILPNTMTREDVQNLSIVLAGTSWEIR